MSRIFSAGLQRSFMECSSSVIIPAYNEENHIEACLSSLSSQETEVIVIVGGTDRTRTIAEHHEACDRVLVEEGANGPGAARNRGIREATGEILLFTDADTVVPEDWVETHLSQYTDERVIGVGGPAKPLEGGLKHRILFKLFSDIWYRLSWPVGFIQQPSFNCSYRRSVLYEEGGFNEEIPFMEDTELSLRTKKHGSVVYDQETCVKTSVRREQTNGYLSLFVLYLKFYVMFYVLRRNSEYEYFPQFH